VFEFKLRPNVKFHNGETLSSSDVKFTFERMIANKAPAAFLVAALDKVEVIDALNFRMVLKFPFGPFITHLAHTATSIVNEKAVTAAGADYGRNPVGTGPFKFVEWKAGDSITLAANDAYHLGAPKARPSASASSPRMPTAPSPLKPAKPISSMTSVRTITRTSTPSRDQCQAHSRSYHLLHGLQHGQEAL
jgi:ABC-type transport system substrate-binding protein